MNGVQHLVLSKLGADGVGAEMGRDGRVRGAADLAQSRHHGLGRGRQLQLQSEHWARCELLNHALDEGGVSNEGKTYQA